MCTAATYQTKDFYFGRTLDYEFSYGEEVVITPRDFPLTFRCQDTMARHHAMIGVAHVAQGYPLYYEAVNEKGLGMAGLNFVGNAVYGKEQTGRDNVATFEFIPWILGQCETVEQARVLLGRIQLTDTPFSENLPLGQLHWMIADRRESIVVESVQEGIRVYDDPVGVLTNNPPFDKQMFALNNYLHLSPKSPQNGFSDKLDLQTYSRGMGALGLPGDLSSQSRFVRVAFVKMNSVSGDSEAESVSQFFHILGSVDQQRGCCELEDGKYEITIYTCCCNADKGIFYYTTYDNHRITAVDMRREDLDAAELIRYPMLREEQILVQNETTPYLRLAAIADDLLQCGETSRRQGLLAMEQLIPELRGGSEFLIFAIRFILQAFMRQMPADRVMALLGNYAGTLPEEQIEGPMVVAALDAIVSGGSPELIKETVASYVGIHYWERIVGDKSLQCRREEILERYRDRRQYSAATGLLEDFAKLEDFELQTILRNLDNDTFTAAMCGVSGTVLVAFMANLSDRLLAVISEDIDGWNGTEEEIVAAQRAVLEIRKRCCQTELKP